VVLNFSKQKAYNFGENFGVNCNLKSWMNFFDGGNTEKIRGKSPTHIFVFAHIKRYRVTVLHRLFGSSTVNWCVLSLIS